MNKRNWLIGFLLMMTLIGFLKRDFLQEKLKSVAESKGRGNELLSVVLSESTDELSPLNFTLGSLTRTANIYEGLVAFDQHLKVVPSLALSWGNLSPTLWEFKLRQGVLFHNGEPFDANKVKVSFDRAKTAFATIKELRAVDANTVQIETAAPDPLLLSKLTKFFISASDTMGTGPYKVREWVPGGTLSLTAFADYWGHQPAFRNVEYRVVNKRVERKLDFENGKIDILAAVPRDQALELPQEQVKKSFGLEVNFLMFKLDDPRLKERKNREAIQSLIDPAKIEAIGNYFVRPATELVAPGVFGFNPNLAARVFDESKMVKDLFGRRVEKISLEFLETYRTLGEYLAKQLRTAGFSTQPTALEPAELLKRIRSNASPLFIIGWQAEDGDVGGFLDAFIHSSGEFNGGRYKNTQVDALIESARQEMNPAKRLTFLQDIMKRVHDDLIAIPLFESSRLYAVKPGIEWEPRVDGLVLAAEVK